MTNDDQKNKENIMEKNKIGGVLSEHGDGTEVLSDYEYKRLKSCLDLMRRAKDPQADAIASAIHEAMDRIARREREDSTLRVFLDCLCEELGEHVEEVVGLLSGDGEPILFRDYEQGAVRLETLAA